MRTEGDDEKKSKLILSRNPDGYFTVSGNIGAENYFRINFDKLHISEASNSLNLYVMDCTGGSQLFLTQEDFDHVVSEYKRLTNK